MEMISWNDCEIPIFVKFRERFNNDAYTNICIWEIKENETHYDYQPFSSIIGTYPIICYDAVVCDKHELTEDEYIACIAHELGHIMDSTPNDDEHHNKRELNADKKVIEIDLEKPLISALEKMCKGDELTQQRLSVLKESILMKSETWSLIPEERRLVLKKVFDLKTIHPIRADILSYEHESINPYQRKECHNNSILFARKYSSYYHGYLVEGVAVNSKGEAFVHFWTKLKSVIGNVEDEAEYDITHDLLMYDEPPLLYHSVKEYDIAEILDGQEMAPSAEVSNKLQEYLDIIPDAKPKQ